jgi:hypothetical protein
MVTDNGGVVGQAKLTELKFFEQSVQGLKEIISIAAADYGKPPVATIVVPNTWTQRELQRQTGTVVYPYIGLTLQRVNSNAESYNKNLRREGVFVARPNSDQIIQYRMLPIVANFRVRYVTQSEDELLAFIQRWLLRQKDAQFYLSTGNFRVKIKIKFADDYTIPEQENSSAGTIFTFDTECDMQSYVGETESHKRINKIVLTTNLWSIANQTTLDPHELPPIPLNQPPNTSNS